MDCIPLSQGFKTVFLLMFRPLSVVLNRLHKRIIGHTIIRGEFVLFYVVQGEGGLIQQPKSVVVLVSQQELPPLGIF